MVDYVLFGPCHVCRQANREIQYCPLCDHWFCEGCNQDLAGRGLAFLDQLLHGRKAGCCGPNAVLQVYPETGAGMVLPVRLTKSAGLAYAWAAVVTTLDGLLYGVGRTVDEAVEEVLHEAKTKPQA